MNHIDEPTDFATICQVLDNQLVADITDAMRNAGVETKIESLEDCNPSSLPRWNFNRVPSKLIRVKTADIAIALKTLNRALEI